MRFSPERSMRRERGGFAIARGETRVATHRRVGRGKRVPQGEMPPTIKNDPEAPRAAGTTRSLNRVWKAVGATADRCSCGRAPPSPLWAGRQGPSQCLRERARATWPSEGPFPWNASSRGLLVCLGQPASNTWHPQVTYQPQNCRLMKQTSQLPPQWAPRPLVLGSVSLGSPL